LFRYRPGNPLEKLLLQGDAMPGCPGGTVAGFSQGVGAGSPGRFSVWVTLMDAPIAEGIFTTAVSGDTTGLLCSVASRRLLSPVFAGGEGTRGSNGTERGSAASSGTDVWDRLWRVDPRR